MSLNIFGALFASLIFFSEGVAGLECLHCIFIQGEDNQPGFENGMPVDSSCENNPHSGLKVDCSALIYKKQTFPNDTKNSEGVVDLASEVFQSQGVFGSGQNPTIQSQSEIKFTCAKMSFTGVLKPFGENITTTIRSCLSTQRSSGFESKCRSGKLEELQGQAKDEEVTTILANFAVFFDKKTQTEACTCDKDNCNSDNFVNGGSGKFPFSIVALAATCLFAKFL